jgi:hypothetical protein
MSTYRVNFYTGAYRDRQQQANEDRAVCFVAHHLNAADDPSADYTLCVVGLNAGPISRAWAQSYTAEVAGAFGVRQWGDDGVCVGGMNGRGNSQIYYTRMPAILPEPLFCSNPEHAAIIRSETGRQRLAEILAASIRQFFPDGGLVAFSIGHRGKPNSNDAGALIFAQPGEPVMYEADATEDILRRAANLLKIFPEVQANGTN